ncbi:Hypothetical predicted protein [Mytilus galloprovincialis]|uniref:B box-type domain-containing protein n=1 Tax=Mytilus galloprovincialis TaxID=29158 RepID=A0A8B6E8N8_MYTGA|nr:Hypothetical predicted protein [Mytilus galloprovincialis]
MAFSKSIKKGQIPLGCQLCEGGNKIEWKCTDFNLLMCSRCKDGVHLRIVKDHRILNINEIGEHEDTLDSFVFSNLKCQDHPDQPCSLYCKTCSKVICLKCIIKVHNGHTFVDEEELNDRKGKLKVILDQKTKLHQAVDQYADKLAEDVDQHFGTSEHEENFKIDKVIQNMQIKSKALESIITSRDFTKFFRDFDKLNISLNEEMPQETTTISFIPNFVPGEFTMLYFGKLELSKGFRDDHSNVAFKVTNEWTIELENVHIIGRCPDGTLWMTDNINKL